MTTTTLTTSTQVCLSGLSWGGQGSAGYAFGSVKSRVRAGGNKEIFFTSDVTTESIDALITELVTVISADASKPTLTTVNAEPMRVTLYIDSPGGSVKDTFKFVDFVDFMRGERRLRLVTVIIGMAASAATIMANVGDERYIAPLAITMVHELFGGNIGTYTQLTSGMKRLAMLHDAIMSLYMKYNRRLTRDQMADMLMKETWFSAEEYVAAGFADAIFRGHAVEDNKMAVTAGGGGGPSADDVAALQASVDSLRLALAQGVVAPP